MNNPVPVLPNRLYDFLKWIAQIVLPALATLYLALAGLLHLPHQNEVSGAIIAIDAFLGAILGLSSKAYNDSGEKFAGSIEKKTLDVELKPNESPELPGQEEVTLKVEEPELKTAPAKSSTKKAAPRKKVS